MDVDLTFTSFAKDKCWWRELTTEEFVARTRLPDHVKAYIEHTTPTLPASSLVALGQLFLTGLISDLSLDVQLLHQRSADEIIHAWLEMLRLQELTSSFSLDQRKEKLSPIVMELLSSRLPTPIDMTLAQNAFALAERKPRGAEYPSAVLLSEIRLQYRDYLANKEEYLAPYTSLVGPSGIGKSFAIKQMAVKHGVPIMYLNLRSKSAGFPQRSALTPPSAGQDEGSLQEKWEQFLAFCLEILDASERHGISPGGLFSLLTLDSHSDFSHELEEIRRMTSDRSKALNGVISKYQKLLTSDENAPPPSSPQVADLLALICFDEARELLTDSGSIVFKSLRSAAERTFKTLPINKKKFFLILLDTTSRVSTFTPPKRFDPLQQTKRLLPPLWRINSWAVFADAEMPEPDHSPANVAKLFSLGRPLWGAYLESGLPVMELVAFAEKMLSGYESTSKRTRDLALLCMRVNYYVGQYSLAEDLVSNYLRFIISVTEERDTLMSIQPREPLLAYVSSRLLSDPSARLDALRSWESCLASGSVNPGDVGEQIAILILLFAFDDACQPLTELPGPIPFPSFWAALFGADCKLPDINDDPLTDASVFFNHFIRVSSPPSQAVIEESYRRGAAIFLPPFYKGVDALIPFKTAKGIGAILVQVKNRQDDKLTSKLKESLKASIKDGIEGLPLEDELPGGYVGMGICLWCVEGTIQHEVSQSRPTIRGKRLHFPMVYALGLDVYEWNRRWLVAGAVSTLLNRILKSWPHLYPEGILKDRYVQRLIYPFSTDGPDQDEQ